MNRHGWLIRGLLGGLGWAWLGLGTAQAGVIAPIKPDLTLDTAATVTVSLYQLDSALPAAVTLQSPSRCITSGTALYKDVTDCWMPEWNPVNGGKSVFVVVNGSPDVPTLVTTAVTPAPTFPLAAGTNPFLSALTTSAYPGQCTNFGSGAELDFQPLGPATVLNTSSATLVGYELKPNDCGGFAVIQVGSFKFLLPRDGTATVPANGLPDLWEALYGGNLDPAADVDTGPLASSPSLGDGISNADEYRGFIVGRKQIRTEPLHKNVFLHLVNPQCVGTLPSSGLSDFFLGSTASSFGGGATTYPTPTGPNATLTLGTGGAFTASAAVFSTAHVRGEIIGNGGGRARIVALTSPTSVSTEITQPFPAGTTSLAPGSWKLSESLLANVYSMVAAERVHLLGSSPGGTSYLTDEWVDNFVSLTGTTTLNVSDPVTDRVVNPNRIHGAPQKGLRVMECLDTSAPSILGWAYGIGSPEEVGNIIVYTQRIITYISFSLIGSATALKYSTASLVNGAWTWSSPILAPDGNPTTTSGDGVATDPDVRNFVISKAMQFYTGMEIGHSLDLTPTVQGTSKTSYGYHFAPGTGDCLDQAITATSKGGTVTFNIPSQCGNADQQHFIVH
jgi:hypothetical protein